MLHDLRRPVPLVIKWRRRLGLLLHRRPHIIDSPFFLSYFQLSPNALFLHRHCSHRHARRRIQHHRFTIHILPKTFSSKSGLA